MKRFGFFLKLTRHHVGEVCRRRILIAAVLLLCVALPLCVGPAVQDMLSDGVAFSGLTLAVTAPEGSSAPDMIEQYVGKMRDVNAYCTFRAMDYAEAERQLREGTVTAILVMPERFLTGVLNGDNPDVELIVRADRPMEALLTYWLGQSVTELLSASQAGIYAVMDTYDEQLPKNLTRDDVVMGINMKYISWTLERTEVFEVRQYSAVQGLPIAMHYALSLLAYLAMALAPLFAPLYAADRMAPCRRLRCLGYGSMFHFGSDLTACTAVIFAVTVVPVCVITKGPVWLTIPACVVFALFSALFGSLCCLLTTGAANSGLLAFTVALLSLGTSGGILPPALLPQTLRRWSWLSPVNWLRELAAASSGTYPMDSRSIAAIVCAMVFMSVSCVLLYHRRMSGQEVTT